MTEPQCPTCGEVNPPRAAFCQMCGAYLGWDKEPAETTAPEEAQAAGPSPTPPPGGAREASAPSADRATVTGTPAQASSLTSAISRPRCPSCGQPTEPGRRFCNRCGYPLVTGSTQSAGSDGTRSSWARDAQEREARKAYRRSLPAFYRWRRVLITLAVLALVAALAVLLGADPAGRVRDVWRQLTADEMVVPDLTSSSSDAVRPYKQDGATDHDSGTAWAIQWPDPDLTFDACGSSTLGSFLLAWPTPARLSHIEVLPGVHAGDDATNQFLPKRLDIDPPHGRCVEVRLDEGTDWQKVPVEMGRKVTRLRVTVAAVYPNRADPRVERVAISEIRPLTKDPKG